MNAQVIEVPPAAPVQARAGLRSRFRAWRHSRPLWGGIWSCVGGLLIAAGPASAIKLILVGGSPVWLGMTVGILVFAFGLFFFFAPAQRQVIGVLVVVLSVASLVTSDFGGFLVGMLLGLVGGSLGFAWTEIPQRAPADT